jgi:hypothetical protein
MTADLNALTFDALDPQAQARFWGAFLEWDLMEDAGGAVALEARDPDDDTGFRIRFRPSDRPRVGPNIGHFDLTSTSLENQQQRVERALELGARHLDIGQGPEITHVVLADPEGNEFDIIDPTNKFLADCGLIGALACDGSAAKGYFWAQALDWPLVWDQDEETAIRSPLGGPKITWGGPPLRDQIGDERVRFDLVPADGSDQASEVERLIGLGARRLRDEAGAVVLADPDGQEFLLS